jgi:hypothetical protein
MNVCGTGYWLVSLLLLSDRRNRLARYASAAKHQIQLIEQIMA